MSFSRTFQGGGGKNPKVLEHAPSISVIVPESPEAPVARRIISTTNRKQITSRVSSHLGNNLSRNLTNREGLNVVRNTEILKNSSLTNNIYTPDKRPRSEDSKTCVQDTPGSNINTPTYVNGVIEETPDFKTPPSYRKTNKRNQINRPGRNSSNVSRIQERARQIGIVRCHSGRKNNSNANMNRNHTIFPLQSTMVNSSYPGNDNLDCPAFFNELCPATQDISEVNVRDTKQIQTKTPSHYSYSMEKGNCSSDISQQQSRRNVTASKKSSPTRRIRQKNGITAFPQLNRLSDFMIAKEEKNRKPCNEVELTCNGFDSDSSDTNSLSSSLSNRSSVDNSGKPLNDSFSGDEDKANHKNESLLVSKLGSCNRKRRSSFLTGNLNSPFRNTSFVSVLPKEVVIPNNVLLPNKNTSKINSSEKYDYLRSDIEAKSNASKVSDIKKGKGNGLDMTRIPSQGSDMSLTLMSCEENGEENILNQVHTTPNTAIPNIDANEIVMEDSDHMFTEALTQAPDESEKNSSVEMESDSDDMFTQALTQSQCQSNKHDKNKSDEDSYNMFSQVDSQVIFPPKTATPQFLNMYRKETVNRADSMESEESIPQKEDNTLLESLLSGKNHTAKNKYQPPSFQNFSSDSAKAAMLQVATELSNKENRNLAIVTADTDDEIKKVSSDALDVDENEELAVSIMTQAYSERLSEGLELTSNHQLEEVENEELPATQPSSLFILQGTLVFVEVRTGSENRSACVISRLESMGANISENLTSRCTHLIFKDGSLSIYNKAKKLGIHIVSVTWIEACRNDGTRLPEANYPCSNVERYENPGLFPKLRKAKSMQPKDPDEFMRTVELRLDRREKAKQRTAEKLKAKEQAEKERLYNPFTYRVRHPLPDHYYNSPTLNDSKHKGDKKYDVLEMLEEASISSPMLPVPNRPKPISATKDDNIGLSPDKRHSNTCSKTLSNGEMLPGALTPSPCTSDDLNTPFLKRLADRINRRSLADHNSKHTPSYTPQMSNLQEQYSRQDAESKETQSAGPEASVNDPDDIMDQIHTKIDHNSLDNSLNPSPIASKSFFVQEINSKRLENITEISHTHQYLKSPKQIRRLRSNCGSIPESHLSEKKYAKAKQIENSSVVAPKQISVEVSKEVSPSKGIIRTRSNRGKILEKPSLQKQNRNTTSHQGNRDESSKKKIKRRHMLFSEKASLLAETPPGSSAELVIQVPSNSKHIPKIQCKGRKSMAGQTSTKIIRSESGSLLYAQPPKSMAIVNRRQSIRLKERPPFKGKINKENFNGSYENVKDDLAENIKKSRAKRTILPPRRSTAEFESPRGSVTRKLSSVRINPKPQIEEIVCTSCSKEDIDLAKQLSKEFGPKDVISSQSSNGASSQSSNPSSSRLTRGKARPRALSVKVNGKVTTTTTHVICGYSSGKDANSQCSKVGTTDERNQMSVRRTMNVLKGILHGCWILSKDWLYASVDAGHWVEEDMYELVDFSPAVRSTRLAREAFSSPAYGLRFQSDVFSACRAGGTAGTVYIGKGTNPSKSDLEELIRLGQGRVAHTSRVASIVVGEKVKTRIEHYDGKSKPDQKGDRKNGAAVIDVYNECDSQDDNNLTAWCVNEKWILDSVQNQMLMPFEDYAL